MNSINMINPDVIAAKRISVPSETMVVKTKKTPKLPNSQFHTFQAAVLWMIMD
jgi:hypothetical protein